MLASLTYAVALGVACTDMPMVDCAFRWSPFCRGDAAVDGVTGAAAQVLCTRESLRFPASSPPLLAIPPMDMPPMEGGEQGSMPPIDMDGKGGC